MGNRKTPLLLLAGLGLAGLVALPRAEGDAGSGRLAPAAPSPTPSPQEVVLGVVDVSPGKGPSCTPKYIGAVALQQLETIGVLNAGELGVEMTVLEKPAFLHKLVVQLYANNQVVWESEAECTGCAQTYAVSDPNGGGYFFRLDPTAVGLASQQWPQATAVALSGMAHDGAFARFSFVRVDGAPQKKAQ